MLNTSRRDKRLADKKAEEEKWDQANDYMKKMEAEIEDLKNDLQKRSEKDEENEKHAAILQDLWERKVIDADGNLME
jgi:exonuclease I